MSVGIIGLSDHVQAALADTLYDSNQALYDIVRPIRGSSATARAWDDNRQNHLERMSLLGGGEQGKEVFERLMRDYLTAWEEIPDTGEQYVELQLGYDPTDPLNTAVIRRAGHADLHRNTGRTERRWVNGGERAATLDHILDSLRGQVDASYATIEWDESSLTENHPAIVVTYNKDAFPTHLHRYFEHQGDSLLESVISPAVRITNYPITSLDENGNLFWPDGGYKWRSRPHIRNREEMIQMLENRRQDHRSSLLSRLPSFQLEEQKKAKANSERIQRQDQASKRYSDFRLKQKPDPTQHIPTMPFVPHGVLSTRRWGIEIETGAGRDLGETPEQWDAKGDGSLESAYGNIWVDPDDCPEYSSNHEPTMRVMHNNGNYIDIANPDFEDPRYCDYCGENGSSYDSNDCVELVSPILKSMHSRGLEQICGDLEFAPKTDSAGVHVHVEAEDLTVRQIGQLVLAYDHIEPLLEASYQRNERGYCKRRSPDEILRVARQRDLRVNPRDMRTGDRYVTVNLQALSQHGTVEFRAMGPVYNYDYLVRWAMFCREMVNAAFNGATAKEWNKVKDWAGVLKVFERYGSEYNMAAGVSATAEEPELVEV